MTFCFNFFFVGAIVHIVATGSILAYDGFRIPKFEVEMVENCSLI